MAIWLKKQEALVSEEEDDSLISRVCSLATSVPVPPGGPNLVEQIGLDSHASSDADDDVAMCSLAVPVTLSGPNSVEQSGPESYGDIDLDVEPVDMPADESEPLLEVENLEPSTSG